MEKYLIYLIHKIGGPGLMLPCQRLLELIRYILKDIKPDTRVILVVSALAKITRMLQDIFEKKMNGEIIKALQVLDSIKRIHLQRCNDLFIDDITTLCDYFFEIEYFIRMGSINEKNPTISQAHLLKFGELMSSEIFHQFLLQMKLSVKLIDAQKIIFAEGEDYCNSIPLLPEISESISEIINQNEQPIILTQGYIGHERLLGLNGSDLTASLISRGLKSCNPNLSVKKSFWKDVDGVKVNGIVREEISINEYNSLETGPVRKDALNIDPETETVIRSFLNLNHPGTKISR